MGNDNLFKEGQELIVLGMLINGDRIDMGARYVEPARRSKRGQHIVLVNGVRLHFPTDRLVDAEEYWRLKRAKK